MKNHPKNLGSDKKFLYLKVILSMPNNKQEQLQAQEFAPIPSLVKVQPGDTLSGIATRYGLKLEQLVAVNQFENPNLIYPGQKVRLPVATPYIVQPGDTLSEIAGKNKTTVDAILGTNPQITNPDRIYPGEKISLPISPNKISQNGKQLKQPSLPKKDEPKDLLEPLKTFWNQLMKKNGDKKDEELICSDKVSKEFIQKVRKISKELGVDANDLMAIMAFESGETFSPSQKNMAGSGATGLIQFMPSTAKSLGTSTDQLAEMTAVKQLDYVEKYFSPYKGKLDTLEDMYMAVLWPAAVGKPNDYVLFDKTVKPTAYKQNAGLDSNKDGKVTIDEILGENKNGITVTNRKTSMKSMNDQELTKLSKRGDKEATYEKNRRKVETATQSGDPKNLKNAHGAAIENKIADELGEDVVKAGEEVKYPNPSNPDRTLKSEIDLETQTEVIQIKSGQDLPDPRQTTTTLFHAQQTGKTPVVYYNANEVPKRTVEQYKKDYSAIKLVPRDDFSFINP